MKIPVLLALLLAYSDAYKILVWYSLPVRSLNILGEGIVRSLIDAGHEVTYITAYPLKNKPEENFRQIDVSALQPLLHDDDILNITYIMHNEHEADNHGLLQQQGIDLFLEAFKVKEVMDLLLDRTQNFDAVIADYLETDSYNGLAALYNCPMIWSSSLGPNSVTMRLVDGLANPAYVPHFTGSNVPPFDFLQRVEELWQIIKWNYYKRLVTHDKESKAYDEIFGKSALKLGKTIPSYEEMLYKTSLILSNFHYAAGNIPALPQNFRLVGGFHIDSNPKPLPQDLLSIIENAKHGVIYFSMGSTWKSKDIPKSITDELIKMFGNLKETVLWKYEETLTNLPKNLHIIKWAPQQSILAHPNIKFFISHGGLLSSTEALHFGIPTIGIPIFYDQHINIRKAVGQGYALEVKLNYELVKNLKSAIKIMSQDSSFKQKAKELSSKYHDRPLPPSKELVYWVEHVIRHGGASHLRSPALMLPWYQKLYLDVILIILSVILILKYLLASAFSNKKKRLEKIKKR